MNNYMLKEFFRENLSPANKVMVRGSAMAFAMKKLSSAETQITQALTPEFQPVLAQLLSAQESFCHLTAEEYYLDGLKTGARLMMEILDDTHENLKPIAE